MERRLGLCECRRIKRRKTNHLQPDRRRCFYLAIPFPHSD